MKGVSALFLPGCKNGSAQCSYELGIYGQWGNIDLKQAPQFHEKPLVFRAAAGDGEAGLQADALEESETALSYGVLDACGDIGGRISFRQKADHFRFGKNAALGGNGDRLCRIKRQFREFVQVHAEDPAHGLEETARSGSAFVVHGKLSYDAVIGYGDGFHVLSADVQNGSDERVAPE